jgi:HK97 gp10 family phage protein
MDPKPVPKSRQENYPGVHRNLQCHSGDGEGSTGKGGEGGKKTSVEVTMNVEGIEEFKAAMDRFDSAMQEKVREFLLAWAEKVRDSARQKVPVRTGYLWSKIYAVIRDWVAEVGAETTYALFVELGTRYMRARPYLYPSLQEHLPELEFNIAGAIEQAKSEAGLI